MKKVGTVKSFRALLIAFLTFSNWIFAASAQDVSTWMPDANLRAAVREDLGLAANAELTQAKMVDLINLHETKAEISNITGIEHATNLQTFVLWGNSFGDLTPLTNLTALTEIRIGDCRNISDVTPLRNLTNLTKLGLQGNNISDVSALSGLVNLTWIRLARNPVTDFSSLSGLTSITDSDVTIPDPLPQDTTAPTAAISVPPRAQNGAFDVAVTFSEPVSGFVESELVLTGPASITLWSANAENTVFTATITPLGDGTITFNVTANVATDAANNGNTATVEQTVNTDITAPTVTISVPSGTQAGVFDVTITFSETVSGFAQSGVSLNGSAASITGWRSNSASTVYTATITPTANGTITIDVNASVATDAANNQNTAAQQTVTIELPPPIPDPATWMPDANLRSEVRADLGLANSDILTQADMEDLTSLHCAQQSIDNLKGLEFATNLQSFVAWRNTFSDLTPLRNLTNLTEIRIGDNPNISDVSPLQDLTKLTKLGLQRGSITDVSALSGMVNLTWIRLAGNPITNFSPLSGLAKITNSDVDIPEPDTTRPTVSITVPSSVQNSAFDVTITFSEAVLGFEQADVSLSGTATASISTWSANTNNIVYTATITPTTSGTITLNVAGNVATDAAGNSNTAATEQTVTVDVDAPTVTITVPSDLQTGAFDATITFSETVSNFVQGDVSFSTNTAEASITAWSANTANTVYTATVTPTKSGRVVLSVAGGVATDAADNDNIAATSARVGVSIIQRQQVTDTVLPSVSISVPEDVQNSTFDATITFSEVVSGFEQTDVSLSGTATATITGWAADINNGVYTALITPTTSGTVIIDVAASVATDAANNDNTAATTQTVTVDIDSPNVELALLGEMNNGRLEISITFTEPVEGFEYTNLSVTTNGLTAPGRREIGGEIENPRTGQTIAFPVQEIQPPITTITGWTPSLDQTTYTAYIKVRESGESDGEVIVNVLADVTTDIAGNPNTAGEALSVEVSGPRFYLEIYSLGPYGTVTGRVCSTDFYLDLRDRLDVNEDDSIDEDDVAMVRAAFGQFGDGIVNLRTDINCDNTVDDNDLAFLNDTVSPTVSITVPTETQVSTFEIRIGFDEIVYDFDETDISFEGSTATATAEIEGWSSGSSGMEYNIEITPTTSGEVVISVPEGAAQDAIGNSNTASSTQTVTVDMGLPTVSITTSVTNERGTNASEAFDVIVTFSEEVSNFEQTDLKVSGSAGASITAWEETTDNITYTATITSTKNGRVTCYVPAGVATDADGKSNAASDKRYIYVDFDAPSVNISVPTDEQSGAFDITITFNERVFDFEQDDVSLAGSTSDATITDWTIKHPRSSWSYGTTYGATITPTTSGTVVVSVPAGVATDYAENSNTASDTHSITVSLPGDGGGAPSAVLTGIMELLDTTPLESLNLDMLEAQLQILLAESDGSLKYLQAIALLENALAVMRPDKTQLLANYPNPFNPETWIPYHLSNPSNVQITIYDARGTVVRQLDLGHQREGYYTNRSRAAYWDGRNDFGERVASGVYFYQLQADNVSFLRKMLILK